MRGAQELAKEQRKKILEGFEKLHLVPEELGSRQARRPACAGRLMLFLMHSTALAKKLGVDPQVVENVLETSMSPSNARSSSPSARSRSGSSGRRPSAARRAPSPTRSPALPAPRFDGARPRASSSRPRATGPPPRRQQLRSVSRHAVASPSGARADDRRISARPGAAMQEPSPGKAAGAPGTLASDVELEATESAERELQLERLCAEHNVSEPAHGCLDHPLDGGIASQASLLEVLQVEQRKELERELMLQRLTSPVERARLEKIFGVERAQASTKLQAMQRYLERNRALICFNAPALLCTACSDYEKRVAALRQELGL
jgi:hypothetical protein